MDRTVDLWCSLLTLQTSACGLESFFFKKVFICLFILIACIFMYQCSPGLFLRMFFALWGYQRIPCANLAARCLVVLLCRSVLSDGSFRKHWYVFAPVLLHGLAFKFVTPACIVAVVSGSQKRELALPELDHAGSSAKQLASFGMCQLARN